MVVAPSWDTMKNWEKLKKVISFALKIIPNGRSRYVCIAENIKRVNEFCEAEDDRLGVLDLGDLLQ